MNTNFLDNRIDYDGSQLRSHFIFDTSGVVENAVAAFVGGCNVRPEHMIDLVDRKAGCKIYSEEMLHFIIENFEITLAEAILHQRLFVANVADTICSMKKGPVLTRKGNDLFEGESKINISVATVSAVSALIHVGVNISSHNTPVRTKGLADYLISPKEFALQVMRRYSDEVESLKVARAKVRQAK